MKRRTHFACRDIGYGIETGEVYLPADGPADWTGKRPYTTTSGIRVYLFDDEVGTDHVDMIGGAL